MLELLAVENDCGRKTFSDLIDGVTVMLPELAFPFDDIGPSKVKGAPILDSTSVFKMSKFNMMRILYNVNVYLA